MDTGRKMKIVVKPKMIKYNSPDEAERWLRANDGRFGKGEHPYLSQRQFDYRAKRETFVNPQIIDNVDFSVIRGGVSGTKKQLQMFQKDRHRKGQRDTEKQ